MAGGSRELQSRSNRQGQKLGRRGRVISTPLYRLTVFRPRVRTMLSSFAKNFRECGVGARGFTVGAFAGLVRAGRAPKPDLSLLRN
jgi:hypothetical protein